MNLREKHKAERRERILDAAERLIREHGSEGLSMREVARRADVGDVTPYNLFGTKGRILAALLERSHEVFAERVTASPPGDPLDQLYTTVWTLVDLWTTDAAYFRAVLHAAREAGGASPEAARPLLSHTVIMPLLEQAAALGSLHSDIPVELVARHIVLGYLSAHALWADGHTTDDAFRLDVLLALTLTLLAAATDEARGRLLGRLRTINNKMASTVAAERPASQ